MTSVPPLARVQRLGLHVKAGPGILLSLAVQGGQGQREEDAGQVEDHAPRINCMYPSTFQPNKKIDSQPNDLVLVNLPSD